MPKYGSWLYVATRQRLSKGLLAKRYRQNPGHAWMLQRLEDRIRFPASFSRPYRDVVKWCKAYIMEELGNLVWIGCMMAYHGPAKFQTLWKFLQPCLLHYLFASDPNQAACDAAAASLQGYGSSIEELVATGVVCALSLQIHVC
jgi:hypothetical protein